MENSNVINLAGSTGQAESVVPLTFSEIPTHNQVPHKKKSVLGFVLLFILLAGIAVTLFSMQTQKDIRSNAALTGPTLALMPTNKTGAVGTTFSVGITMNTNTTSVTAAELHLSYDPSAVQILSFTRGTVLPTVLTPATYNNGTIAVVLSAIPPNPFKGANIVGTLLVKILAAKQSAIYFTGATQVAILEKDTNALTSTTGIIVTGTATGTTTLVTVPANKTAVIGETFPLGVTINTNTDIVSAANLHLSYDPSAIQILSFTPGTVLPVVLTPETHVNGAISVVLSAKPSSPFKGVGIVGTWTIKILAAKQSSLKFMNSTQVVAIGNPTNILVSSTGSSIIGTSVIINTPTPTPIQRCTSDKDCPTGYICSAVPPGGCPIIIVKGIEQRSACARVPQCWPVNPTPTPTPSRFN